MAVAEGERGGARAARHCRPSRTAAAGSACRLPRASAMGANGAANGADVHKMKRVDSRQLAPGASVASHLDPEARLAVYGEVRWSARAAKAPRASLVG